MTPGGDTSKSEDKNDPKKPFQRFQAPKNYANALKSTKFEGDCDDLKGYVFEYTGPDKADVFNKTLTKIQEYVGKSWYKNYGSDVHMMIKTLAKPVFPQPADMDELTATNTEMAIWKKEIDMYVVRKHTLTTNNQALYALVLGQCSEPMRNALEAEVGFEAIDITLDGLALILMIKNLVYQFHSQKYLCHAIHESVRRLTMFVQPRTMPVAEYLEKFQSMIDVIDSTGGTFGIHDGVIRATAIELAMDMNNLTGNQLIMVQATARDRYLGTMFLLNADRSRFGRLIEDTENSFLLRQNVYPRSVTEAYNMLFNWKQDPRNYSQPSNAINDGVSFTTVGRAAPGKGKNPPDISTVTCYICSEKGHYSPDCPNKGVGQTPSEGGSMNGTTLLMNAVASGEFDATHHMFVQVEGTTLQMQNTANIPSCWVLLDSQSTIDIFHNEELLSNIREADATMTIHSNGGTTTTNLIGDYGKYGSVWYDPDGIANVLSMSRMVNKGYNVKYNSNDGNCFVVIDSNGITCGTFIQSPRGLYYQDTNATQGLLMVNTVAENKSRFTNRDCNQAESARKLQRIIGRPNTKRFMEILDNNLLPNCPVTRRDVVAAERINGPDVGSLKGKTVRRPSVPVTTKYTELPAWMMKHYQKITLAGDVMFINKIAFFVTISRNVKFGTSELITGQKAGVLMTAIKQVQDIYTKRGFKVDTLLMDGQFEPLRAPLSGIGVSLNTVARDEHVPEVERWIRFIKERMRAIFNTLPFEHLPPRLIVEMVHNVVYWYNSFPSIDGISKTLSPRSIVVGSSVNYDAHCQLEYGEYVQTHEQHNNSMATRTTGALALRPTGNSQGGQYFYSLNTGRVLRRNRWTKLPMPDDVIARVNLLARRNRANPAGLQVVDRNGDEVEGHNDYWYNEEDGDIIVHDPEIDDDDEGKGAIIDDDHGAQDEVNIQPMAAVHDNAYDDYEADEDDGINEGIVMDAPDIEPDIVNIDDDDDIINYPEGDADLEDDDVAQDVALNLEMDAQYGARSGAYNLRERKARNYDHLHVTIDEPTEHGVAQMMFTQYGVKKGLELYGEAGAEAITTELRQLHDRRVIKPVMAESLTIEQRKAALGYLMFLKEKRTGEIKGRGCADGRKQRPYIKKEDTSSPTVAVESVFITGVTNAWEKRDVATADVPGAFMQVDMDEIVHMVLKGTMAKLLIMIDPELYQPFVVMTKGEPMLYLLLPKALYGTLKAALLFWKDLTSNLLKWGFEVNQYDQCVMNKIIEGTQCTVLWHVDDLKISHVSADVVSGVLSLLEGVYGQTVPLTVTRGKKHDYLGMQIDYGTEGKVQFTMFEYINNILQDAPPEFAGESATPAAAHLFEVNDDNAIKLGTKESESFHHMVAQLLFLCKRARPDIQTAIAFLCTRVKSPDEDDWKKLGRVIKYLRSTAKMPLTLEASSMSVIKWWVDASFAVHSDMKSHTGGAMSMGKGVIYGTSTRQKLNTKSSTEAELVGVSDVLPQVLWTRQFLLSQGYDSTETVVYQDNQSAILLEKNGRLSSGKRTRHINIRYFFIADRIKAGELIVEYCPTGIMLADFFTKPLQGVAFKTFRDQIMNVPPDAFGFANNDEEMAENVTTTDDPDTRSVLEYDHKPGLAGGINEESGKSSDTDNDRKVTRQPVVTNWKGGHLSNTDGGANHMTTSDKYDKDKNMGEKNVSWCSVLESEFGRVDEMQAENEWTLVTARGRKGRKVK